MLLLAALMIAPPPKPAADFAAMERGLKASLPEGWAFVSARAADFKRRPGNHPGQHWLATLEAKKAGDFTLVVTIDHGPPASARFAHSWCEYAIGVGKPGTKRSVAEPWAVPQCNAGDRLVIPIPVMPGDMNHRFTFTAGATGQHRRAYQYQEATFAAKEEKPAYEVTNEAAKHLTLVRAKHSAYTMKRSQRPPFTHHHDVVLEAVKPGKLSLRVPVEVVKADAKVTAWVGTWHQTRGPTRAEEHVRGEYAGPPAWVLRVGDRLRLPFENGTTNDKDAPAPALTIPAGAYVEPKEPYPAGR